MLIWQFMYLPRRNQASSPKRRIIESFSLSWTARIYRFSKFTLVLRSQSQRPWTTAVLQGYKCSNFVANRADYSDIRFLRISKEVFYWRSLYLAPILSRFPVLSCSLSCLELNLLIATFLRIGKLYSRLERVLKDNFFRIYDDTNTRKEQEQAWLSYTLLLGLVVASWGINIQHNCLIRTSRRNQRCWINIALATSYRLIPRLHTQNLLPRRRCWQIAESQRSRW